MRLNRREEVEAGGDEGHAGSRRTEPRSLLPAAHWSGALEGRTGGAHWRGALRPDAPQWRAGGTADSAEDKSKFLCAGEPRLSPP